MPTRWPAGGRGPRAYSTSCETCQSVAQIYAGLSRLDEAFASPEKAYPERSTYPGNLKSEPTFDRTRT